jgi:Tfp pilus assembly protein PilN
MRPVNLIPPEDRRGDKAPLRSGPLSYIVIGALALVLVGVLLMVTTSNDISEKEGQVAQLEADLEAATTEAQRLAPYAEFADLRIEREATIASLAQSRFDWERVMRELALVIPEDVTLTNLNGSAFENAEGSASATPIAAPNLTLSGCAASHESVARFVAALEDIDGVTRVALGRSEAVEKEVGSGGATDSVGDSTLCGSANTFDVTVAFDNATVSAEAAEVASVETTPASTEIDPENPTQTAKNSTAKQTEKAKAAAEIVPGVVTP